MHVWALKRQSPWDVAMTWIRAHSIKTLMRADGKARVFILSRDDGLYMFEAESERAEDGYTYWVPTHHSGLFDSAETAEREAVGRVSWLSNNETTHSRDNKTNMALLRN
jgi:hypothetical protein